MQAAGSLLPEDIVVVEAWEGDFDFSARHSAKSKTYLYRVQQGAVRNPFTDRYAWYVNRPLDLAAMREALASLLGTHDFSSFRAAGGAPMSPVRTLYRADIVEQEGEMLEFVVHGNGFLYHMVRNIVGTVVDVGKGRLSVARFKEITEAHDRHQASPTAPACGLYLYEVEY